jgi:hypothetical protein
MKVAIARIDRLMYLILFSAFILDDSSPDHQSPIRPKKKPRAESPTNVLQTATPAPASSNMLIPQKQQYYGFNVRFAFHATFF